MSVAENQKARKQEHVVRAVLPIAHVWARRHEAAILRKGTPLTAAEAALARAVGVRHPEKVRLLVADVVPPVHWPIRCLGERLGLLSRNVLGMTLRYGIYIQKQQWGDRRLLAHELAHVAQYERLGGFKGFLARYLQECLDPGYPLGELEREARRAEQTSVG